MSARRLGGVVWKAGRSHLRHVGTKGENKGIDLMVPYARSQLSDYGGGGGIIWISRARTLRKPSALLSPA